MSRSLSPESFLDCPTIVAIRSGQPYRRSPTQGKAVGVTRRVPRLVLAIASVAILLLPGGERAWASSSGSAGPPTGSRQTSLATSPDIPTDNGWTQEDNGAYLEGTSNPNCYPLCVVWPLYPNLYFTTSADVASPQLVNDQTLAYQSWNNDRQIPPDPYIQGPASPTTLAQIDLGAEVGLHFVGLCADTQLFFTANPPGQRDQGTLYRAEILIDPTLSSSNCGGSYVGVYTHEFGHALGLGHTALATQVMNPSSFDRQIEYPQSEDIYGFNYIY